MIRHFCRLLLAALLVTALVPALPTPAQGIESGKPQTGLSQDTLVVETAAGQRHRFKVDLALTVAQQAHGLMFVEKMADDYGMLFLYEVEQPLSFWMMNTLIPLDIIYVDDDGEIINIQHGKPRDATPLRSSRPALAVLEIRGGRAAELGIRPGDRLLHPAFGHRRPD